MKMKIRYCTSGLISVHILLYQSSTHIMGNWAGCDRMRHSTVIESIVQSEKTYHAPLVLVIVY